MKKLKIYIDGSCRPNPGKGGIGIVITENGKILKKISKCIGEATNNIAEYEALLLALKTAYNMKAKELEIMSDSELLTKQMNDEYKVKNEKILKLFKKAKDLEKKFNFVKYIKIPRKENKQANLLALRATE